MSNENQKNSEKIKENNKKTIKYGIMRQITENINLSKLFNIYFDKIKPNVLKNTPKSYEFIVNKYENISFNFDIIPEEEIPNLYNIYNYFNFFMIFTDIQSTASLKILESYIDRLIDCSEDNTKKCYIFGIYKDSNNIINKDEQITTILNCKGIDYEYSEININLNEDFSKGVEYILEDSKEIMEEIEFEELHNKNGKNPGKSCLIL